MSGESVFNLIEPEEEVPPPQPRHKSKFSGNRAAPPTASTFGINGTSAVVANMGGEVTEPSIHSAKKPLGIFGRDTGSTVNPADFLKKNEGPLTASRGVPTVNKTRFLKSAKDVAKLKADIPSRYDKPVMGMKTDKNYVVANAVESVLAIPTKCIPPPVNRAVDRDDFGKVPAYLSEVKAEIEERHALVERLKAAQREAEERWSELSAEELEQLRQGLQRRWDALNSEYQSRGFSKLQTPSQKAQHETLGKELNAVEFAMHKLSRSHVFVYDDQR
ncbi:enkurin [Trypanosoma rangeli]|uniref:Enkurin n=1 Tax=Trypanosoma rangeli TaxID=5698 RepID=A0A3R7RTB5_TRYRA|nr:enkurin [Trypanosoma rangeli]RNF12479.1 enkurin [Trypanosoma rangeli]|eukprot:RNF12479.1 enkurin [Trypanosoma rangeli]